MGKSLEFIKERIQSGGINDMENNKYNKLTEEQTPFEILEKSLKLEITGSILCSQTFEYNILNKGTFKVKIIYNPNAEYDYFTTQRCLSDGTYAHLYELMEICVENIINLKTYFKNVTLPKDLSGHTLIYTIGNFVLTSETDKEKFKTDDKPWLDCRFTAMLPIKFEIK